MSSFKNNAMIAPLAWLGGLGILLALSSLPAQAQDGVIGFVKTVKPDASVLSAGNAVVAVPGTPIMLGQTLKTGPQGSMGVTFKDDTVMSFGPNTELVVEEYLYAPNKGEVKLLASLTRGTLYYVSGVIARLKPEAVAVRTPVGIIGVRGTRFVASVEEDKK